MRVAEVTNPCLNIEDIRRLKREAEANRDAEVNPWSTGHAYFDGVVAAYSAVIRMMTEPQVLLAANRVPHPMPPEPPAPENPDQEPA